MITRLDSLYFCVAPKLLSQFKIKKIYEKSQESLTYEDQVEYYIYRSYLHIVGPNIPISKNSEEFNNKKRRIDKKDTINNGLMSFFTARAKLFGLGAKIYDGPRNYPQIDVDSI